MIKKLINEYLSKPNGLNRLKDNTGVSDTVINAILNGNPKKLKFRVSTLDALYEYFGLCRDNFYMENMKKRFPNTDSLLGTFLRNRRITMGITVEEIAKELKSTKLTILRLELGESLPHFSSYTMQNLMFRYGLTPVERQLCKNYIQAVKDIEKIVKKQYIDTNK